MKKFLAALAFVIVSPCAQSQLQSPMLIDAQAQAKPIASSEQLRMLSYSPGVEWIRPIKVDASALKPGTVSANLLDQQIVITFPDQPSNRNGRTPIWTGHAARADAEPNPHLDMTNAQLYRSYDGSLAGHVSLDGAIYQLRLLDGQQVLIKRDAGKIDTVPDAPLFKDRFPPPLKRKNAAPPAKAEVVHNTIRVLIAFTNSAVTAAGGLTKLEEELTAAIDDANNGYAASDIELSLETAALAEPTYTETTVNDALIDLYEGNGGMWLPHYARDQEYADVIVLVVNTSATEPNICGQSAALGAPDYSYALSVVQYNCLLAHSLPHEISHLMWADHDPDNQLATPPLVDYGHGYRKDQSTGSAGWSTIMAYSNCAVRCPRINLYSSPALQHDGLPAGTEAVHNNAQLIRETNYWIAEMYPDPPVAELSSLVKSRNRVNMIKYYTADGVSDIQL